jgi:hypothetical protein
MKTFIFLTTLIIFCCLKFTEIQAQKKPETALDSVLRASRADTSKPVVTQKLAKKIATDSFPSPKKALLWSIIPGGGQVYNRKYWYVKLPIVYGGFVLGGYFIQSNTEQYRLFKTAYFNRVNNLPLPIEVSERFDTQALKSRRDAYDKRLQQSYNFTVIWYFLSGMEAFTAAHLAHFDISDDISMRLKSSVQPILPAWASGSQAQYGFSISLNLH